MTFEWTLTEDWETPMEGESWHDADSYEDAYRRVEDRARELKLPINSRYSWYAQTKQGIVVDFGSHGHFGLIRTKGTK